jgi:hypothetical protein
MKCKHVPNLKEIEHLIIWMIAFGMGDTLKVTCKKCQEKVSFKEY